MNEFQPSFIRCSILNPRTHRACGAVISREKKLLHVAQKHLLTDCGYIPTELAETVDFYFQPAPTKKRKVTKNIREIKTSPENSDFDDQDMKNPEVVFVMEKKKPPPELIVLVEQLPNPAYSGSSESDTDHSSSGMPGKRKSSMEMSYSHNDPLSYRSAQGSSSHGATRSPSPYSKAEKLNSKDETLPRSSKTARVTSSEEDLSISSNLKPGSPNSSCKIMSGTTDGTQKGSSEEVFTIGSKVTPGSGVKIISEDASNNYDEKNKNNVSIDNGSRLNNGNTVNEGQNENQYGGENARVSTAKTLGNSAEANESGDIVHLSLDSTTWAKLKKVIDSISP